MGDMSGNKSFTVGRAKVTCVDELVLEPQTFESLFAPYDQDIFEAKRQELPEGYSRENNGLVLKVQNWLIEVDGRKILLDSGFGNDKTLPGVASEFNHLNTPFLDNLRSTGINPEDIDTVLMTHVHIDHVGWNTRWDGHQWVPTFPNAQYILTDVERQYWDSTSPHYRPMDASRMMMENCFEESMLPIIREGLVRSVGVDSQVDDLFRYVPAPGHTPGQSAIRFECDGEGVLFAGDSMHHPIQIAVPEWNVVWDEDHDLARRSRRRLLEMCADEHLILAPAHFTQQACRVQRAGQGFRAVNVDMDATAPCPPSAPMAQI